MIRNDFCTVQRRYDLCPVEGVHPNNSARREAHEQTAAGGCECIDRFNKGTAIAANPLYRVRDRDNPTVSSCFATSLDL